MDAQRYNDKLGKTLVEIVVSSVPRLADDEIESFKAAHVSDIYLHPGEPKFEKRSKKEPIHYQYARWDWLHNNKEKYVNILRVCGFEDAAIQLCLDGKRPLNFTSEEIHRELVHDLAELKTKLETEANLTDVRFVQTGSSVPGFSTNPFKGFAKRPSKITCPHSSDADLVIVANGWENYTAENTKKGLKLLKYPTTGLRDGTNEVRLGYWKNRVEAYPPALNEFYDKWTAKLGGGLQLTFQEGDPHIAPWEHPIPLDQYN